MGLLTALLESKKLQASLAGVLLVILNDKFGLGISPDVVFEVVFIVCAYVVGQGIADFGKYRK